jgi:formylglycine-generating enzyme required for sulfatase activity
VKKSGDAQVPWESSSLTGDFYFRPDVGGAVPITSQQAAPVDTVFVEVSFWESIKNSTDAEDFQAYLDKYPNGQFVALAEKRTRKKPSPENEHPATATPLANIPVMVRIPGRNYEIGKYEITQVEWHSVMGSNPSYFSGCGNACPVERVSWNEIQEFIRKLNAMTGRQYRLPSEAEWEYACHGGSNAEYCGGSDPDSVAWYGGLFGGGNSGNTTHAVGQKQANGFGLYDMSGNVWELTNDCYKGDCTRHVLRGGSWRDDSSESRFAFRSFVYTKSRGETVGFRVARTLP